MSVTNSMIRGGLVAVADLDTYQNDLKVAEITPDLHNLVTIKRVWRKEEIADARQTLQKMLVYAYEVSGVAQQEPLAEHAAALIAHVVSPYNWQIASRLLAAPVDGTRILFAGQSAEVLERLHPNQMFAMVLIAAGLGKIPTEPAPMDPNVHELQLVKGDANAKAKEK